MKAGREDDAVSRDVAKSDLRMAKDKDMRGGEQMSRVEALLYAGIIPEGMRLRVI